MSAINVEGLRIGLCQQPCVPAQPEYNGAYFEGCIEDAERDQLDLLVGVEGIQGYLIGDQYESPQFLAAVADMNTSIVNATKNTKVVVAYGSVISACKPGEDGRMRRYNGGYVIQDGRVLRMTNKTLSPNYRMFPEARHFFDNRKLAEESALATGNPLRSELKNLLRPVHVVLRDGRMIRIGQQFCEDMWENDYVIKPTLLLAENGADIIINHSASPWTWRKNNKRHRVVRQVMQNIPAEIRPKMFVYVNRTGVEQSNKNFYAYDGGSCVYDRNGELVYETEPYQAGTTTFVFAPDAPKVEEHVPDDSAALYLAMRAVVREFYGKLRDEERFVYIGLSGGIDSALKAAILVDAIGPNRVIGVNMPYGKYNSAEGRIDAYKVAVSLGIQCRVIDITKSVDQDAEDTGVQTYTLAHKNIQARHRMLKLAALAQNQGEVNGMRKLGGRFTANGNKVEMAFGYGTMYADIAGATMLMGDLVKREVYQLADYYNRVVFKREVIPASVFHRPPADELSMERSRDPFDYGNLERRGYHDEWVRAVTEHRWDPMRFLTEYAHGTLEKTFLLPEGHLNSLFPTASDFILRLEKDWKMFTAAYWKRMQCPPVPVFTRRAFGGDLSESLYAFDMYTQQYKELKDKLLGLI